MKYPTNEVKLSDKINLNIPVAAHVFKKVAGHK